MSEKVLQSHYRISPNHDGYFYILHSSSILLFPGSSLLFLASEKLAGLDPQYFQNRKYLGVGKVQPILAIFVLHLRNSSGMNLFFLVQKIAHKELR